MIDITTAILAIEPNASFICKSNSYDKITWLSSTVRKPSREEVIAKVKELEKYEPINYIRIKRNQLLLETDWEVQRNTERNITDTNLINYRNALRDLPQEIENGNIPAPTLDENGMLVFEHWPNRYEINIEDEPTANNSANTV